MADAIIRGSPFLDRVAVDGTSIVGDGTRRSPLRALGAAGPFTLELPNGESVPMIPGQAVTSFGDFVRLASASSQARATAIGIVVIGAGPTLPVTIALIGPVVLPPAVWDVITGQSGGLSPDATYYLDGVAGTITTTHPISPGTYLVEVGRGIKTDELNVAPTTPLLL